MAAFLEKIGWSDETEMLAKLYALVHEAAFKTKIPWEQCLPTKYRAAATYSIVKDQTPEELRALSQQLEAFATTWKSNGS